MSDHDDKQDDNLDPRSGGNDMGSSGMMEGVGEEEGGGGEVEESGMDDSAYIDLNTAVEVEVDDSEPMDDDDDEEDDNDDAQSEQGGIENPEEEDEARVLMGHALYQHVMRDGTESSSSSSASSVYAVASHYDEASGELLVVSGGGDDRAFVHVVHHPADSSSSSSTRTIPLQHGHSDSVSCVALNTGHLDASTAPAASANGMPRRGYAAVGSYDGTIALYDLDAMDGSVTLTLDGPTDVEFVSFHPKGGQVLLAGSIADGTVWMYHVVLQRCLQVFVGHESTAAGRGVSAGGFTADGRWALSAGMDGTLRVWAPRTGACRHVFRLSEDGAGLVSLAILQSDDALVLVGSENGNAYLCHVTSKKQVATLRHADHDDDGAGGMNVEKNQDDNDDTAPPAQSVEAVGFCPFRVAGALWAATGGVDGRLKIWDLSSSTGNSGHCRHVCFQAPTSGAGITRLQWHSTEPLVFTSTTNGMIRLWNALNGTLLQEWPVAPSSIVLNDLSLTTRREVALVVAGCDNGTVQLLSVPSSSFPSSTTNTTSTTTTTTTTTTTMA